MFSGFFDGSRLWVRLRLAHRERDQSERQERRQHRNPEHRRKIVRRPPHQADRHERPDERTDGVERLPQAEARAAQADGCDIGDQCIARRAANALADAVDEARGNQPSDAGGKREQRFCQRGEPVAERGEQFAPAEPVGQRAGEDFRDRGGRLGNALDEADGERGGAEHGDEIDRQQRVDHLGGDVHQHRDETEHPDPPGQPRTCNIRCRRRRHVEDFSLTSLWPSRPGNKKPASGGFVHAPAEGKGLEIAPPQAGVISPLRSQAAGRLSGDSIPICDASLAWKSPRTSGRGCAVQWPVIPAAHCA